MTNNQEFNFEPEDLLSDEFWSSHGIEMITIDPNDESTFGALVERIDDEVEQILHPGA